MSSWAILKGIRHKNANHKSMSNHINVYKMKKNRHNLNVVHKHDDYGKPMKKTNGKMEMERPQGALCTSHFPSCLLMLMSDIHLFMIF